MKKSLIIVLITMFIQAELLAQIVPIGFNAIMPSHLKAIKTQSFRPHHILSITNKLNGQQSKNKASKDAGEEKEQVTRATIGAGNITINGTQATDAQLVGLNRDVSNTQEVTKDKITGALDGSITIDNRVFSGQGWASMIKDFTNLTANIGQIAENITNNNIIVQAISTALDVENSLDLVDAVKQYLSLDGKTDKILDSDKLKKEINGATNLDPEKLKESFKEIAEIYNENGEKLQGLEIANINGNIAGLSYVDKSGQKQTITIDLANVDITDPKAIANIIAHETTNIQSHHANEANAENRGSMASAIMDMKNYGNENTNNMTTSQWLNQVGDNHTFATREVELKGHAVYIRTTKEQDAKIYQKAVEDKSRLTPYRLLTNNCVDAIQDVFKAGNVYLPLDVSPIPNNYFRQLKQVYPSNKYNRSIGTMK